MRKRQNDVKSVLQTIRNTGHTTAPGAPNDGFTDSTALLWFRPHETTEWCEDTNHRERITAVNRHRTRSILPSDSTSKSQTGDVSPYFGDRLLKRFSALKDIKTSGAMSRVDKGSALWIQRRSRIQSPGTFRDFVFTAGDPEADKLGNWGRLKYTGGQIANGYVWDSPLPQYWPGVVSDMPDRSEVKLSTYGPKGFDSLSPLKPKASIAQFLVELRQLPTLPFRHLDLVRFYKQLGSEYLNVEFGWKPFIKDLKAFCKAVLDFDAIYQQLHRDSGRPIRRKGEVFKTSDSQSVEEVSSANVDWNSPNGTYYHYQEATGGSYHSVRTTLTEYQQRYWFSGSFTYWLPAHDSAKYRLLLLRVVYGVDLTPRLLYELMPWSWLIDWFTNVGPVISGLQEQYLDGLVAPYAYIMGHYRKKVTTTVVGPLCTAQTIDLWEVKAREPATPYGFGLQAGDFTDKQNAILAALALSRL